MPTFSLLPRPLVLIGLASTYCSTLPYPYNKLYDAVSVICLAPSYFRRGVAWPVSYYALFQGMAASKPTSWLSMQLYLLNHLAYIWDLNWRSGLFPSWPRILSLAVSLPYTYFTGIRSLTRFGIRFPDPHQTSALPPVRYTMTLCLNAFRGEPASSWLDWHFTPNHNSSADFSTSVRSNLHVVSPTLHPGHG